MKTRYFLLLGVMLFSGNIASGADYNLRLVTDASPDYSDMPSLIHSVTANWPTEKEKCWAMFYWNHIARRQTQPMILHGTELTDAIRQFNDYGFTMCSTISGINTGIWANMGLPVRFWDITLHTVPEVRYGGRWHMYDDSLSAIYTLCDGVTIAGVEDIGKALGCAASAGKVEPGHIARYHCLTATSANGFLSGADTPRSLLEEGQKVFNPAHLKHRTYFNNWEWGHRYILNLRENESYTRFYRRLDAQGAATAEAGEGKRGGFKNDPAYYVPNANGKDPEAVNPRYHIRGNGRWMWRPALGANDYAKALHSAKGIVAAAGGGLQPEKAGVTSEAVYRVESANVTASQKIKAAFSIKSAGDRARLCVSINNGLAWTEVWESAGTGEVSADLTLIKEVSGAYEPMLKVELLGQDAADGAVLKSLEIETVTQLNSKTQPKLRLGKNTVYVGAGEPTASIVLWPELQGGKYKRDIVEESNIVSTLKHPVTWACCAPGNPMRPAG